MPPPRPTAIKIHSANAVPQVVVNHYSTDKLMPTIPGFKTSAAFLTSLSANLRIDPDLPSPLNTPLFRSTSGLPLPPPSPLSFSTLPAYTSYPSAAEMSALSSDLSSSSLLKPASEDVELPSLSTYTAESAAEKIDGLRLVADSVAQQRQLASKHLIFHPANLAAYFLTVAVLAQYMWKEKDDVYMLGTTVGGLTMIALVAVRMAVGRYLALAEDINWDWLGDDRMLVVKWGGEIIGALVLGWADNSERARKRGTRRRRGKAVVRAWTVKLKYRGKGVGEGLLEEAVKVAGERGADGIVFDGEHANSKRVLPSLYNGFLTKRETQAEKALEKVADEKGNFRQRRSSPTWGSR